jgi:hypothetical protein
MIVIVACDSKSSKFVKHIDCRSQAHAVTASRLAFSVNAQNQSRVDCIKPAVFRTYDKVMIKTVAQIPPRSCNKESGSFY